MNILANIKTGLRIASVLLLLPFLFSCGGSGGSGGSGGPSGPSGPDTQAVLGSVARNVSAVIATNADGVAGVGGDSAALASLLEPFGITLADNGGEGLSDQLIDLLEILLDNNTATVTTNGNTVLVRPSPVQTCDEIALALGFAQDDPLYDACLDALGDVLITIVESGTDSGTMSVSFDGHVFLTMVYSPTRVTVALDIEESVGALQSLVLALDPEAEFEVPETLAGVIELDMQVLGDEHGRIELAITEAIQVVDSGASFDIDIAPATLFTVEADGINGTATISSTLNAISAMFPVVAGGLGEVPGDLNVTGANISVSITDSGNGATGDLGIGPITFDIDNAGSTENIFEFLLDPQFDIDPDTGEITLETALNLELSVNDGVYEILLGQDGTLDVDAEAGTAFVDVSDGVFQVTSGQVVFVGTGDFAAMSGTVVVGECFDLDGPADCVVQ